MNRTKVVKEKWTVAETTKIGALNMNNSITWTILEIIIKNGYRNISIWIFHQRPYELDFQIYKEAEPLCTNFQINREAKP